MKVTIERRWFSSLLPLEVEIGRLGTRPVTARERLSATLGTAFHDAADGDVCSSAFDAINECSGELLSGPSGYEETARNLARMKTVLPSHAADGAYAVLGALETMYELAAERAREGQIERGEVAR